MQQPIIVGMDPGTTVGLAILDTNGKLISVFSRRNMSRSDIIKEIEKRGRPIIIACDVKPAPDAVEKMAATFGCKLFYPEEDLMVSEKVELIKGHKLKDDHQQDALASAIKAYRSSKKLIERIKNELEKNGQIELFEEVVIRVLKEGRDISEVISNIQEEKKRPEEPIVVPKRTLTPEEYQKIIDKLQKRISQKDSDIVILRKHTESLIKEIETLRNEIRELTQTGIVDKEINRLWHRIALLEKEIENLKLDSELIKKMRGLENKDCIPLVEITELSHNSLSELNKKIDLKGRAVFTNATENLDILNEYEIKALVRIAPLGEKEIEKLEFPVVSISEDLIDKSDQIKFIKGEVLEKELKTAKKSGLVGWLKRYRERKG